MRNVRLDETQAGIKIAGRNIINLRYADDTTLMAEREEELMGDISCVSCIGRLILYHWVTWEALVYKYFNGILWFIH